MVQSIINFSIRSKLIILLGVLVWILFGIYSLFQIPIGAVPDVTNNQVQVLTTSRNLSTLDVEQFITYPIELEMANLPGVVEIRSISKFGLSVVTIVFEDDMGTYLPRQLIAEKLKTAQEKIPQGFGTPEMGPITTGLGEIYQYILDVKPGYESRYSAMELRTIQDWIVKRQLAGIPGVVEVNTWGGYLKQYEVALDPKAIAAMNVSIDEIYQALQSNNSVAGGGYIEKAYETYFVRGEGLVASIEDIKKIAVKNVNGIPIYLGEVGEVKYGYANRFGAITANGEGEKVMGQIMMLKDASVSKVIRAVKERVEEVQGALPEGVVINPFLERSELLGKTTFTIAENLTLGALIVIFVVVLLLGNLRSGFIIASVIPLSLLFGISMMNLFGLSANLMSLGAIDFGIIIDGSVIIIEYVFFQLGQRHRAFQNLTGKALQEEKDRVTKEASNQMMRSAIFGQVIILIVFVPILSLSGIEGKMFRPMALSFGFALVGAMILCLTYVPVMASLFCQAEPGGDKSFSDRLIVGIQSLYLPVFRFALRRKATVLSGAGALFLTSILIFLNLGGEFIPTLDEGDYVVQPVLKTGTSLGQTIETMTDLECILLDSFPEVDQVVSRIGAAEVPTDPMSMEETDVIIKLKPKKDWTTATNKDALAEEMKRAMSAIPGIGFEFTQPIEMRFNELITGVRADVAIKIYGENLDRLNHYANQVEALIRDVPGAADVNVEKVVGLPQMSVKYNRDRIAQYGLNIADLNHILQTAFAGRSVGIIFEGEKRFDLVVRLKAEERREIGDLRNLYVDLPGGDRIPLSTVADIDYQFGPAQISRDNTRRRIVVSVNVRNRDVESVVNDISEILDQHLALPEGYYIQYGGQFENLQNAKRRLSWAIPLALSLILVLLYLTFGSLRQALLVFSAIPMAAIGGILTLWIRGLPFSISAGVGFIALFGIAVLNGIVLIDYFNVLRDRGISNIHRRVMMGTQMRLRPVLLTASAASLGFLPMALSTSAGAEVQRPLATVVIGGLVTATLLTLVILPILYTLFDKPTRMETMKVKVKSAVLLGILALLPLGSLGQQHPISLEQAIAIALKNNTGLQACEMDIQKQKMLQKTAIDPGRTAFYFEHDENNVAENGNPLNVYGVTQNIPFPSVLASRHQEAKINTLLSAQRFKLSETLLKLQVSQAYYHTLYQMNRLQVLGYLDSLFFSLAHAADRKFEVGETDYLEKLTAESRSRQVSMQKGQVEKEVIQGYEKLKGLLQTDQPFVIAYEKLTRLREESAAMTDYLQANPTTMYFQTRELLAKKQLQTQQYQWLPSLSLQYFRGFGIGENARTFDGYGLGLSFPLWFSAQQGRVQASRIEMQMAARRKQDQEIRLFTRYRQLQAQIEKYREAIDYYESQGLKLGEEIVKVARRSYQSGETGYLNYILSLENAQEIYLDYIDNLHLFNQIVLEVRYFISDQ